MSNSRESQFWKIYGRRCLKMIVGAITTILFIILVVLVVTYWKVILGVISIAASLVVIYAVGNFVVKEFGW